MPWKEKALYINIGSANKNKGFYQLIVVLFIVHFNMFLFIVHSVAFW